MKNKMNTFEYPRNILHLSGEERASFDVDDSEQVAKFIHDAISSICGKLEMSPSLQMAAVIESMLDDGALEDEVLKDAFREYPNNREHQFRDFVMDYVVNNYKNAVDKYEARSAALKERSFIG